MSEMILRDATEIMESLPVAMRHDDQIMDCVIESLQSGVSKLAARQDALEIAQLKLQETVAHGFNLVNNEIQCIKHEAEKDRIHANYAQKAAEQARAIAEQAWLKTQEVAIGVVKAEAKADGARDLAKQSNRFQFDPLTGMTVCAIAIILAMLLTVRFEKVPQKQNSLNDALKEFCENPNNSCTDGRQPRQPIPANNRGNI